MNIFQYFEDNSIRCLVGRFKQQSYNDLIMARKKNLYQIIAQYFDDKLISTELGSVGGQRSLIINQRFEQWKYPVFCINLQKSNHTHPFFILTKGWNKIYANFLARRNLNEIPVLVINYGRIPQDIIIEKDIYTQSEMEDFVGAPDVIMKHSYRVIDGNEYLCIDHIRDDKVNLSDMESTTKWLSHIQSLCTDKKITISIIDTHNSDISNTNDFFQIIDLPEYKNKVPPAIERTTHIREYKNLLRNDNETVRSFILVTNCKIKLDLFDIIWFLQDHASDYVSEDRSYSILGPGPFRADSVLPRSEL